MTTQELDRLAYAGAEPPDGLGYADTLYFLMLRALYCTSKQTNMSPEQGRREKAKIVEAVRTYQADEWHAMVRALQLRDTGAARADYRKARNAMGGIVPWYLPPDAVAALAAADRIVEALDNIPIERRGNGLVRSTPNDGEAPENAEAGTAAEG